MTRIKQIYADKISVNPHNLRAIDGHIQFVIGNILTQLIPNLHQSGTK